MTRKRPRRVLTQRSLHIEPLEDRRCLASSVGWDGPGLGSASLSYYIGSVPSSVGLAQSEVESAIETALDAWAQIADITFTQTTVARQSDSIDITFTSLDGSGSILAQAYLPDDVNRGRLAGDIQFDVAEPWEIGNALGSSAFDLVYVAVHEIGHALGLDHLNVVGSVMRPSVSANQVFTSLSAADANAILDLYAATSSDSPASGTNDSGDTTGNGPTTNEVDFRWWRGRWGQFGGWWRRAGVTVDVLVIAPSHHHVAFPTDVNGDNYVSAVDALLIINELNGAGSRRLGFAEGESGETFWMIDVTGDGNLSALDALLVINELNRSSASTVHVVVPGQESSFTEDLAPDEDASSEDTETVGSPDTTSTESSELPPETETDEPIDQDSGDDQTEDEMFAEQDDVVNEDESQGEAEDGATDETDDETTVDDGPVEEEPSGCFRGRADLFTRFDANEDGLITQDEVSEAVWARLTPFDTNDDEAVSTDEFLAYRQARYDLFARFDADDSGSLTESEVPARLWARLVVGDTNEDMAITPEELEAISLEHHHPRHPSATPDTGQEGVLSRAGRRDFMTLAAARDRV